MAGAAARAETAGPQNHGAPPPDDSQTAASDVLSAPTDTLEEVPVVARGTAVTILAAIALVFAAQVAQPVLVPVVLAVLISCAFEPLVSAMVRCRLPRAVAAAVMVCALVGGVTFLVYELRPQAVSIATRLPEAARRVRQQLERANRDGNISAIQQVQNAATELAKAADATAKPPAQPGVQRVQIEPPPVRISDYLMWGSYSIAAGVGQFILIAFLSFFLLASGDLYRRKLVKIIGTTISEKKVTVRVIEEINAQLQRFLIIQVFTSAVVGVASWLAFRFVGLEEAGLWGLMAGLFNSIPYFGPVVVTSGVAVVAFLQFGTFEPTALAAGLALLITTLEGLLLTPWLTSRAGRMNGPAVFVGLLFWGWLWNIWGVLLAVPMLMALKTVCDHVEDLQPLGEILGE
jgi:predicted PurR-regulated permease PerM